MVARRMKSQRPLASERGIALAVVLLILVVVLLLGTTLISVSVTEDQAGSIRADMKKAFSVAETGIQEAMYRMRLDPASLTDEGDTACTTTADPTVVGSVQGGAPTANPDPGNASFWKYNPFTTPTPCSWTYSGSNAIGYGNYFGGIAANLDSAGRTFKSSGSAHATEGALVNAYITNTASDPRAYTVTVTPLIGHDGTCWQYVNQFGAQFKPCPYDPSNPPSNPMFKVTSTGTAKNAQKVLSVIIQRSNINDPNGALEANTNINIQSASAIIDGRNYDCNGNNPSSDANLPATTSPTGAAGISVNKPENLQCDAGTGIANCGGTSGTFPDTIGALLLRGSNPPATQNQIDGVNAYLESLKIDPIAHPEKLPTSAFHGILYVDGNYAKPPDGSTGILIVHHRDASNHDVATLGNFNGGTFKGLIIADKINKINGNAQIIGGIFGFGNAADGITVDDVTGTPNIKYSKCAIDTFAPPTLIPYQVVLGTWHEQHSN